MVMPLQSLGSTDQMRSTKESPDVKPLTTLKERVSTKTQAANEEFFRRLIEQNPQNSTEIVSLLTSMLADQGGPHFTTMAELTLALGYTRNELEKSEDAPPELAEAVSEAQVQLFGLNGFIEDFKKRIFFPTEENGGVIEEW